MFIDGWCINDIKVGLTEFLKNKLLLKAYLIVLDIVDRDRGNDFKSMKIPPIIIVTPFYMPKS